MRPTWISIPLLFVLATVAVSAGAVDTYDGPTTIEGDVTWTDASYALNETLYVNETASLTLVNTSLMPSANFTGGIMIAAYGPVEFNGSIIDGGRWYTVISSSSDVTVRESEFANASYAVLTGSNLTVSGSSFSDLEYGFRSGGERLSVSNTTFEGCDFGFTSDSGETVMDDVRFVNTTYIVGSIRSSNATLTGIRIDGAGEGISLTDTNATVQVVARNVKEENCDTGCGGPSVSGSVLLSGGGSIALFDSDISSSDGGIVGYDARVEVENTTFTGLGGGLYGYRLEGNVSGSTFADCGIGLEASKSDVGFTDCTFTNMTVEARQWWLVRVDVVDPYDDAVGSAEVTLTDSDGNVTNGVTNVAGFLDTAVIAYQRINGSVVTYGPYDVSVEKDGFEAQLGDVALEDDVTVDVDLPYFRPDINVTGITVSGRGEVTLGASVANDGDHVAENVTVTFTYKAGFNVIVIDSVDVGDIEAGSTGTAEVLWDAQRLIDEGYDEFQISVNAEARNQDPEGSDGNNYDSMMLDAGDIEEEDEEPSAVLVSIIIAMMVIIAFLVVKFVTRRREVEGDVGAVPHTWKEAKERGRRSRKRMPSRTHRGRTPAPKGRAPGRRRPPAR